MSRNVQAVVIGGGVVGTAVLRELAQAGVDALLLEAEPALCEGTSKANSAIVHTGFDAKPGTLESRMLRRAAELWPALVDELGVPFLDVGALMLAREDGDVPRLREMQAGAAELGVATELLDATALRDSAPFVTELATAALSIPGESIIDPFWLTRRLAEAGIAAGAQVWTDARVTRLEVGESDVHVGLTDGRTVVADQVFNCAGLWTDEVASLAGDTSFAITPRRGQFLISEETFGIDRIVLPLPSKMGKGMLVTPIVFGGLLLGPTAEDLDDKTDRGIDAAAREAIREACAAMVPAVRDMVPIRQFAGLRAVSSTGDYILRPSTAGDRLYHVAGIRSTGISASPAIAEHVVAEVIGVRRWRRATRSGALTEAGFASQAGPVVCLCRSVSAAELLATGSQPIPPATLDAAKRACGTTFGDCQGNLCAVPSVQILASMLDRPPESIEKHHSGSWLFERAAAQSPVLGSPPAPDVGPTLPEVVTMLIVGGGLAGIGAALAAADAGVRPVLVERTAEWGGPIARAGGLTDAERHVLDEFEARLVDGRCIGWLGATVASLLQSRDGWEVSVQDAGAGAELVAERVVLACGGYVEPREHRAIDGPRPSGVTTADLVHSALDAGLLPGRRAVVVGNGRLADGTAARMQHAGMAVERAGEVTALRGEDRLESACADGSWVDVDLLVLADALVPAPFLLRPLGLVDNRPGVPAPTDARGATPLPGLWAAGTCRAPDVDHLRSLDDGRAVMLAALGDRAS